MKTTRIIGLLLALGMCAFLSNASAELPKPGEYKGTLTITKVMGDRNVDDPGPEMTVKTVFKATARVDADGYIRVTYSGDRAPIFGRFVDNADPNVDLLSSNSGPFDAVLDARKIEFSTATVVGLIAPDGQAWNCLLKSKPSSSVWGNRY